jgi:enamine deaminase RidA (YjgF/YER057c/UK114 family)
VEDIVKVTQSLIRRSDLEAYRPIRTRYLGDARPALMLSFVQELVWPGMLIELEVVAAKAAG